MKIYNLMVYCRNYTIRSGRPIVPNNSQKPLITYEILAQRLYSKKIIGNRIYVFKIEIIHLILNLILAVQATISLIFH